MRDKRAFIVYILLTLVIWQLCVSLSKIFLDDNFFLKGANYLFFTIIKTENKGAAFGLFQDSSLFLGLLGVIVLILTVYFVFKKIKFEDKFKILTAAIFSAGILGNTIERLIWGHVVDYIKLTIFDFPVFNLFDVLISVSVVFYIFYYLKTEFIKKGGNENRL